ncbi:MAG: alpha/beta hydrolase [Thermoanaerobaculia bacterium]|nr:alpha/beta hydrolase [Thermoanaerobaculia bacterium]
MKEQVVHFGSKARLVGIVSEPERRLPEAPAVLLLNSGTLHRVGPNRLYVTLSRQLAARGLPVMRFDFSGIGDSGRREDRVPFLEGSVEETREAMDLLEERFGTRQFLLLGLCSGGNVAFATAVADERVTGCALINVRGHLHGSDEEAETYYRNRGMRRHYLRMATRGSFRWKNWRKALAGQVDYRGFVRSLLQFRAGELSTQKGELGPELGILEARGVELLHLWCEGDEGLDYAEVVLEDRIERLEKAASSQLEVVEGADHTFTLLWSQERLHEIVGGWVDRCLVGSPDREAVAAATLP